MPIIHGLKQTIPIIFPSYSHHSWFKTNYSHHIPIIFPSYSHHSWFKTNYSHHIPIILHKFISKSCVKSRWWTPWPVFSPRSAGIRALHGEERTRSSGVAEPRELRALVVALRKLGSWWPKFGFGGWNMLESLRIEVAISIGQQCFVFCRLSKIGIDSWVKLVRSDL